MIRKEVFDSLNTAFDGRLIMSGVYDAYLRISYKWKVDYVDKPLARYRVHKNSKSQTDGRKLIAIEIDLMIKNLMEVVSEFKKNYPDEIRLLKRRRDVQLSLLDWKNREENRARKRLRVYIRDGIAYFILYFLMYLPYRYVYNNCHRIYTKAIVAE